MPLPAYVPLFDGFRLTGPLLFAVNDTGDRAYVGGLDVAQMLRMRRDDVARETPGGGTMLHGKATVTVRYEA